MKSIFKNLDLYGLRIGLDCANGSTFKIAPEIFKSLGAKVYVINNNPNGENINLNCGSTHMSGLVKLANEKDIDIGFAFDGDGDRCLAVDERANILHGDEIMSICAYYLNNNKLLNKNSFVVTVMSNLGLFLMGKKLGIDIKSVNVGDRYVLEKMLSDGYNFGGERSGHIIFLDHTTTGDGILTALYLSKILVDSKKKLSQLNNLMEVVPQILLNARVSNNKKNKYLSDDKIKTAIENLEKKFKDNGRVVIRPSGTESLIRVMLEGYDKELLLKEGTELVNLLEKNLS
jgi:phosphoglucosamine mutase